MATPNLPTDITAGQTTGHADAHETIHEMLNVVDESITEASEGDALVADANGVFKPTALGSAALEDVEDFAAANHNHDAVYAKSADLGSAAAVDVIDEDDMASNSATAVPTQQSVKAYIDAAVAELWQALQNLVVYYDADVEQWPEAANDGLVKFFVQPVPNGPAPPEGGRPGAEPHDLTFIVREIEAEG